MRGGSRKRDAIAGELLQRDRWKIRLGDIDAARRRPANAAYPNRRSSPRAPQRKDSANSFREIVAGDCGPVGKARANNLVSESARILYFAALRRLRRSAGLPQLQRGADLSSTAGERTIELSPLRSHRGGAEEMSKLRKRCADLRWFWDRER